MDQIIKEGIEQANKHLPNALDWNKWNNSEFKSIKDASTTVKGNWGENLTTTVFTGLGFPSSVVNGGIGDYDILCQGPAKSVDVEHKLATEDSNGRFQFNSIDPDKSWDIVYCLGVAPNNLYFTVKTRSWCVNNLSTSMTKAGGGYKWTVSKSDMIPLTESNLKIMLNSIHSA
jgi:hypothetical protein